MKQPKTYDDYLEEVQRDTIDLDRFALMERLARTMHSLDSAKAYIDVQYARLEDYQNAAVSSLPVPRYDAVMTDYPSTLARSLQIRWPLPHLEVLSNDWMYLKHPENVADLLARTGEVWGRRFAESLFAVAYPKPTYQSPIPH